MSARVSLPAPSLAGQVEAAIPAAVGTATAWPPPPHDPRERELAKRIGDWEIRLFGGRMFQYFVSRGFWHLQLWSPSARVSVLSPSRLTCGFYEAYPVADWKAREPTYDRIAQVLAKEHGIDLPNAATMLAVEKAMVSDVARGDLVRAQSRPVS